MALNPQITNPDLIYTGNDLIIPTNDNASNPYASWSPDDSNETVGVIEEEVPPFDCDPIGDGDLDIEGEVIEEGPTEFSDVQWESFEDAPVEPYIEEEFTPSASEEYSMEPSYEDEFCQTDFEEYQAPDSYYSDDFSSDYTTDFV